MQSYGLKIQTNRGDLLIEYRNESNGYYYGEIQFSRKMSIDEFLDYEKSIPRTWRDVSDATLGYRRD